MKRTWFRCAPHVAAVMMLGSCLLLWGLVQLPLLDISPHASVSLPFPRLEWLLAPAQQTALPCHSAPTLAPPASCQPDHEGSWAIGIFIGDSPQDLVAFGPSADADLRFQGPALSRCRRNPVLTCADVTDVPSNFVADPFLWLEQNGSMLVFFETKSNTNMQGDIGVARSDDAGASWRHLGVALDEPWHLSYPHVFEWQGRPYLLPEAAESGMVRLYEPDEAAGGWPLRWRLHSVLLERPLLDPTLIEWQGKWWMFGTDMSRPVKNAELEAYYADSPLGPWTPHALNPLMDGDKGAGARPAGRMFLHDGHLHRFGQDCNMTYGHGVVAYRIDELSPTSFKQTRVPLKLRRADGAPWRSARQHHIDAHQMPDGRWLAAVDYDEKLGDIW